MPASKRRISSPLEAGPSILDVQNIPPQLSDVLDYTAGRLARKGIDLTLIVLYRDYQLPSIPSSPGASPGIRSPPLSPQVYTTATTDTACPCPCPTITATTTNPTTPSPSRLAALAARPVASIRKKLLGAGRPPLSSPTPVTRGSETAPLPLGPSRSRRWPPSPTPLSPPPPITPCSPFSAPSTIVAADSSVPPTPISTPGVSGTGSFALRLVYPDVVAPRHERILRQTIDHAGKKLGVSADRLPQIARAATYGLSAALTHRSLAQNEVFFSAEGLTLVSLDRLYTFKTALASYSRTGWPPRLEDAVDELRRLVLVRRRATSRAELLRSYDGLRVSAAALAEVDRMYRRAYGGAEQAGAIDGVGTAERTQHAEDQGDKDNKTQRKTKDDAWHGQTEQAVSQSAWESADEIRDEVERDPIVMPKPPRKASTPSLRKAPILKLQTQFYAAKPPSPARLAHAPRQDEPPLQLENSDEDRILPTARPGRESRQVAIWSPVSIAEVLGDDDGRRTSQTGPMTPKGYDDISPITRGEWGFLMGGATGGMHHIRTAAVVRC